MVILPGSQSPRLSRSAFPLHLLREKLASLADEPGHDNRRVSTTGKLALRELLFIVNKKWRSLGSIKLHDETRVVEMHNEAPIFAIVANDESRELVPFGQKLHAGMMAPVTPTSRVPLGHTPPDGIAAPEPA
jgi:hypothetical protein